MLEIVSQRSGTLIQEEEEEEEESLGGEEEEEEEGLFRADAVNEEDPERDRATQEEQGREGEK